jgi:hypothetical protein
MLGECHASWRDGHPWIDQADPRVPITTELLDMLAAGECVPEATLALPGIPDPDAPYTGARLRIDALNRTVIYRIGEYLPDLPGYIAEWPD